MGKGSEMKLRVPEESTVKIREERESEETMGEESIVLFGMNYHVFPFSKAF